MQLAHKIALKPTHKQIRYFRKACGVARFTWNWGLAEWGRQYEAHKQDNSLPTPNALQLKKQFNAIKREDFPWVYEVTKYASQQPFIFLQFAFSEFFKGNKQYPKFKKKGKSKDSFYVGGDQVKTIGKKVKIPNLGWVNMREELKFSGSINSMTISREADRWYVSFSVNVEYCPLPCENQASTGVDLGINALATLANGQSISGPKPLKKQLRRLKRAQRKLSKKQKGSNNRYKQQIKVAKRYRRIANIRKDQLHKLTTSLTDNYQYIAIEDLNVQGMLKNKRLSRAISDMGFHEFKRQLLYKADMKQCHMIVASQWYPSSKTCSQCGVIKEKLTLKDRTFECSECNLKIDRDINAAINLKKLINTESSSGIHACGQDGSEFVYYAPTQPAWVKQEASPVTV